MTDDIEALGDGIDDLIDDRQPSNVRKAISTDRRATTLLLVDAIGDETLALSELADLVAAVENGCSVHSVTAKQRKLPYVGLYQSDLSRLSDAGLLDVSDRTKDVGPTRLLPEVCVLLCELLDIEDSPLADEVRRVLDEAGYVDEPPRWRWFR